MRFFVVKLKDRKKIAASVFSFPSKSNLNSKHCSEDAHLRWKAGGSNAKMPLHSFVTSSVQKYKEKISSGNKRQTSSTFQTNQLNSKIKFKWRYSITKKPTCKYKNITCRKYIKTSLSSSNYWINNISIKLKDHCRSVRWFFLKSSFDSF